MLTLAALTIVLTADGQSAPLAADTTISRLPPFKLDRPDWLPLTPQQIAGALAGRALLVDEDYQPFPGVKIKTFWMGGCPPREAFSSNGDWSRYVCQRGPHIYTGRWKTEKFRGGDRLCVEAPDFPKLCRFVWREASDNRVIMAADPIFLNEHQDDPRTFNPYRLVATKR
jgi:hypothetical protein